MSSQGRGPNPIEKLAINTIVAVIGRKASLSIVFSENISQRFKTFLTNHIIPDSVSFRTKYIPRAIIETPIRTSEIISSIFLPNLKHVVFLL